MFGGKSSKDKDLWLRSILAANETKLVRYVMSLVKDLDAARDIVQDAFLKLWQAEETNVLGHESQWLFTVCRNQAFDILRKRRIHREKENDLSLEVAVGDLSPEEQVAFMDEKEILNRLISRLTPDQREVIELKFFQDLSYKEISAITGHTVNHVGVLIHNVVSSLASSMKKQGQRKGAL